MGIRSSQKTRRNSGRRFGRIIFDGMNKEEVINYCLDPQVYWDDWKDYRDGFRVDRDRKHLRSQFMSFASNFEVEKWNNRLRRLISRRIARKVKYEY